MSSQESYVDRFHRAVRDGKNENSYKLAWARAILDIVSNQKSSISKNDLTIEFSEIAERMIGYYWDQTFFFDLCQGQNPNRPPEILSITKDLIEAFKLVEANSSPKRFAVTRRDIPELTDAIVKAARVLKQDVAYRFPVVDGVDGSSFFLVDIES